MAHVDYEQELFGEGELENEFESESEFEMEGEGESESEQFFGEIAQWGKDQWKALNTPGTAQRKVALDVARAGLKTGLGALGTAVGGRLGAGAVGGELGTALGSSLGDLLPSREYEMEGEGESSEGARPYVEAAMEYLGKAASEAETDEEANAYLGALAPLAAQLAPSVGHLIVRSTPALIPETISMGQRLRQRDMRPLIRVLPSALRNTVSEIANQRNAHGRTPSPQHAIRGFARNMHRLMSNPRASTQAYRRSQSILSRAGMGTRSSSGFRPARPQQRRMRTAY